jgi:cytochrome oxidase Cu insertion factor (SCO1/SenC/PrrC family)
MKRVPLIVLSVLVVLAVAAGAEFGLLGNLLSENQTQTSAKSETPGETPELAQGENEISDTPETAADFDGSFSLTDQYGMRRTDKDFRGKYMLVFFGYTFCPDVCPTTLAVEKEALDKLGADADRIVPIFISVDPKRDTADKLKTYLSSFDAKTSSTRPNFVGLTGSDKEIAEAAKSYRVYYRAHIDGQARDGSEYSIDHTGDVYLMDPQGKFVAYYSQGILPDELAADLKEKTAGG